jgi:hypothetical protein
MRKETSRLLVQKWTDFLIRFESWIEVDWSWEFGFELVSSLQIWTVPINRAVHLHSCWSRRIRFGPSRMRTGEAEKVGDNLCKSILPTRMRHQNYRRDTWSTPVAGTQVDSPRNSRLSQLKLSVSNSSSSYVSEAISKSRALCWGWSHAKEFLSASQDLAENISKILSKTLAANRRMIYRQSQAKKAIHIFIMSSWLASQSLRAENQFLELSRNISHFGRRHNAPDGLCDTASATLTLGFRWNLIRQRMWLMWTAFAQCMLLHSQDVLFGIFIQCLLGILCTKFDWAPANFSIWSRWKDRFVLDAHFQCGQ